MKRGETYSSGWMKAQDLLDQGHTDGLTLTIKGVRSHKMDDGKTQRVLSFHEDDRELGLNQTNWDFIAEVTGKNDDDEWIGRKIHAYPHKLDRPFQGYTHGMRIKTPGAVTPSSSSTNGVWTFEQAIAKCYEVAITKPELIERLKTLGKTGYIAERDTGAVRMIIDEKLSSEAFNEMPGAEPSSAKATEESFG